MSELVIRAILKDEFSAAAQEIIRELGQIATGGATAGAALRSGMSSALPTVQGVTDALGAQNAQLRAQIAAYKSDAGAQYLQEQKALRAEIEQLTASGQKQGLTWTDLASKYYIVSQAAGMVASATMAIVDASSRYDSIKVRIDAFEGSAEAGARAFAKLQELAKQPGLGLEQASSAYASLRALRESGPEAVAIIEAIAHANASMGGGAEEFGRAMAQIQQMLGKGKLMAEDINTISESIPNFRALMMDAFGTTDTKALNAKYSVDELLKGIEDAASKLPAPGETIKNNMDNIGDAWTRLKASIGNTDAIKTATGALANLLDLFAQVEEKGNAAVASSPRLATMMTGTVYGEAYKFARGVMAVREESQSAPKTTSQSEAAGSFAAYKAQAAAPPKVRPKTQDQIDKEAKEAKNAADFRIDRIAGDVDIANEKYNDGVKRRYQITQEIQKKALADDRKADDAYWKAKEKDEADFKKKFNANQKASFEAYKRDEEAKTKATEKELRKREAIQAAVYGRIGDIMTQSLMVGFQPLDDIYSRMAARNAEMEDSFAKTFEGIGLAFATMMTKMAEEMAAKAAIFGLFSLFGGGGFLGGASSFIFGARASGGAMFPGVPYRYNEDRYGGGGEVFRPASAGTASPERNGGGGATHVYHFAAGTSRADAGFIVRSIEQASRERRRTVARAL